MQFRLFGQNLGSFNRVTVLKVKRLVPPIGYGNMRYLVSDWSIPEESQKRTQHPESGVLNEPKRPNIHPNWPKK
jgi:hypothetical protein